MENLMKPLVTSYRQGKILSEIGIKAGGTYCIDPVTVELWITEYAVESHLDNEKLLPVFTLGELFSIMPTGDVTIFHKENCVQAETTISEKEGKQKATGATPEEALCNLLIVLVVMGYAASEDINENIKFKS